ncbi:hypothetical protein T08_7105 [Trichinella sp. T8]|nr:hypothetical protein T08_7105 [Trichinella sp. T8]
MPRLRRSAGFCRPGQCLHAAGSTNCWISATRFRTKGFQRSADDCIHARVTALSHQQVMPCTCRPSIFWTERTSLAATRAPMSSSLGRVNLRIGATRVFDVTKFTTVWWFVVSIRMYATAPYAFSDASQNAWISKRVTWPRATGISARGRRIFDRCGSSCFQRLHCSITSCGNGSSHDVPRCHRVWRNIFARTVNGAKHPTGSKTRNAVLNNDRFDSPPGLFTIAGGEKLADICYFEVLVIAHGAPHYYLISVKIWIVLCYYYVYEVDSNSCITYDTLARRLARPKISYMIQVVNTRKKIASAKAEILRYSNNVTMTTCSLGKLIALGDSRSQEKFYDFVFYEVCRPKLRLEDNGIWTCETKRSNGLRGCPLMSEQALNAHVIIAVEWYDSRCVTLTSSYLGVKAQKRVIVKLPSIVHNYNTHMGGVDLNEMLSKLYRLSRRS